MEPKKLSLIQVQNQTDREKFIYSVYCKSRECTTGSMVKLYKELGMRSEDFYRLLDNDFEFKNAIERGLSDSRTTRLLELESALIELALGREVVEEVMTDHSDGSSSRAVRTRKIPPNLQAIQVLLEKYEGSSWGLSKDVKITAGNDVREVPYDLLTSDQLKKLAGMKNLEDKK